jgi:DNA adenine methylase
MSNPSHQTVLPVRPVAPYLGGKRHLAKRIIAEIEAVPHEIYAEAFVGMGGVFLRRSQAPKSEVINDFSREVATFFRVLQRHYVAFMEMIKFQLTTRAEFERLVATNPETLTDLERSARFLYLQRTAFGGKPSGRNFGVSPANPARFDVTKLGPMLEDLHTRLTSVVIECLPYGEFISRYDRPQTLFYLDPPYWGCEGDYGRALFERADFERLAALLEGLQGRFILSLNDVPEVRDIFSAFPIVPVETVYSVSRKAEGRGAVGEVLIMGGGKA